MNTSAKGRRNEHKAREWLEARGYQVTRSAASKGAWDLVGISQHGIALAQVKSNCWPGSLERDALAEFEAPPAARKFMFRFDDRRPGRVKELSKTHMVFDHDGQTLAWKWVEIGWDLTE